MRSLRITASVANWGVRLPALAALVLTQGGALAGQVSLPMLAPLLLGLGMTLRSIKTNAGYVIPRVGLVVVLLWSVWFTNGVLQNCWVLLRKQGRLDARVAAGLVTLTECVALVLAGVVLLSSLGVNISALLLPAGVCVAIASKDLLQNTVSGTGGFFGVCVSACFVSVFLSPSIFTHPCPQKNKTKQNKQNKKPTGFFLFLAQPFRIGNKVGVCLAGGGGAGGGFDGGGGGGAGWFEGVCEQVDLRYTVLR